jgi:hypothetical protein
MLRGRLLRISVYIGRRRRVGFRIRNRYCGRGTPRIGIRSGYRGKSRESVWLLASLPLGLRLLNGLGRRCMSGIGCGVCGRRNNRRYSGTRNFSFLGFLASRRLGGRRGGDRRRILGYRFSDTRRNGCHSQMRVRIAFRPFLVCRRNLRSSRSSRPSSRVGHCFGFHCGCRLRLGPIRT